MKTLRLAITLMLVPSLAMALKTGEARGRVKDSVETLPGVNIVVKGTTNGALTDFDGNFVLANIPEGTQTLVISYIGYDAVEKEVEIEAGNPVVLGEIMLKPASEQLAEVMVSGSFLPSTQKALSIKKNAIGIMEVMASDAIGKLPDRNAAEAVQRMQGVSIERDHGEGRYVIVRGAPTAWNSTLLNGNRMPSTLGTSDGAGGRTAPLDIFPSEMIEYVQLSKAITPDMEGDAIGGSVNFMTKAAPIKRTLNANIGTGYNAQAQKPTRSASVLFGDRIANGKFGYMVSGTYWMRNWGTDNYEMEYDDDMALVNLQLRDYLGTRTTYGANFGAEYEPNANNKFVLRGMYTQFLDDESATESTFYFQENEMEQRVRNGITGINLYGGELSAEHRFGNARFKVDWKVASYVADMKNKPNDNVDASKDDPGYYMAMFTAPVSYNNLASDGKKYLDLDAPAGYSGDHYDNVQPNLASMPTRDKFALSTFMNYRSKSYEQDNIAELNLTFSASERTKFKAGGKFKRINLERGSPMDYYMHLGAAYGAPDKLSNYQEAEFPYNGGYLSEIGEPYNEVLLNPMALGELNTLFSDEYLESQGSMVYHMNRNENNASSAGGFYNGFEQVVAAYAMGEFDLNPQLKLIAGARYEHTFLEYDGLAVETNEDKTTTIYKVSNNNDYGSFLPMAHLKFSPKENLNLKLAYTRTLSRPDFDYLNPTETTSPFTNTPTISRGNINLQPTYSNNFDLMGEYFFSNVGLLSGGVFYKSLSNLIYSTKGYEVINGITYRVTQPNNSETGWLTGFELGINKRLDFLPSFWSGFGVEGNYTFAKSEMDVPEYSFAESGEVMISMGKEQIPNQSNHIFNAAVFYEKGIVSVRLAGNYKGAALAAVQGAGPEAYRWYDKNFSVDMSASFTLTKKLRLYLELNNLTNAPLRYYHGNVNRPEQVEYYSIRGMMGINYNL